MPTGGTDKQVVVAVSALPDRNHHVLLWRVAERSPEFRIDSEREDRGALARERVMIDREFPIRRAEEERVIETCERPSDGCVRNASSGRRRPKLDVGEPVETSDQRRAPRRAAAGQAQCERKSIGVTDGDLGAAKPRLLGRQREWPHSNAGKGRK